MPGEDEGPVLEEREIMALAGDRAELQESGPATSRSRACPIAGPLVHGALGCPSRDELTQQDIYAALLAAKDMGTHQIEVEMTDAGVLLRGTVASPDDRARAVRTAQAIAGARLVREALAVQPSAEHGPEALASERSPHVAEGAAPSERADARRAQRLR